MTDLEKRLVSVDVVRGISIMGVLFIMLVEFKEKKKEKVFSRE